VYSSSSVFCTAKYRGGVRRTEGLKKRSKGNGLGCNLPSPAVSCGITGYYVIHIEETPKKLSFLRRGVGKMAYSIFVVLLPLSLRATLPIFYMAKRRGRRAGFSLYGCAKGQFP